jgi:hypothetical protein
MPKDPERDDPASADDELDEEAEAAEKPARAKSVAAGSARTSRRAKARSERRRLDKDEDRDSDDDGDDDDDDIDERPRRPAKRSVRGKGPYRGTPVTYSEKEIDSPSLLTLGMLGSVALATITMWGAAKFACNAHPPETRKPRQVATAELARDPKGAAFEMQQRWSSYDFDGALQLASGAVAADIKRDQQTCAARKSECDQKKQELAKQPLTLAALLERDPQRARVHVTTLGGLHGRKDWLAEVTPEGGIWKVVSRVPYVPPPRAPVTAAPRTDMSASAGDAGAADAAAMSDAATKPRIQLMPRRGPAPGMSPVAPAPQK